VDNEDINVIENAENETRRFNSFDDFSGLAGTTVFTETHS
jgi:hypothetical protein